ncbi:MAG: Fic family protein [Mycoplasmataceae bacterium]|nr:Fic family protein [Mycoplasmataceae bacterium]
MALNKSGRYISVPGKAYRAFNPSRLPPKLVIDNDINSLLVLAHELLGQINQLSELIPNKKLFLSSFIRKEALFSSQIEGTQCSLIDLLDPTIETNANMDKLDVVNYINAIEYGINRLDKLPISSRLIKEMHKILLHKIRGQEKTPGEFRISQNWVGGKNSTLKTASYIPPAVDVMNECMSDLEKYMNRERNEYDILIQVALIHYQFETIHPFLDGNGRIGRILIILFLIEKKVIQLPVIYISYFLKKEQQDYYTYLNGVREKGKYEEWIKFFLKAFIKCCEESIMLIKNINTLIENDLALINKTKANKNLKIVFNFVIQNPITNITIVAKYNNMSFNGANKIIRKLIALNILKIQQNKKKFKTYCYAKYLKLLKEE